MFNRIIIVSLVFSFGIFLSCCAFNDYYAPDRPAVTMPKEPRNPIYEELAEQGRMTTGQIETVYGVPCVEVMLQDGESIRTLLYSTPSLKEKSLEAQDRIALINGIHYLLVVNGSGNVSTEKNKIFVPLDFSIEPKILPQV
jgi:hypothetical protein